MTSAADTPRDPQAVARFVERFASVLVEAGFPRMPARAFVALLATDSGRLTAGELAAALDASPAAISGAVRYLIQVNLAIREREPGSRRDHFHVREDAWYEAAIRREQLLARWTTGASEGVVALGRDSPAGARLAETLAFFDFLGEEMPALLERWQAKRAELHPGRPSAAD